MKNSIKDKLFNYMFNTLCKERHSDLIRAVSAMQSGEKRGSKSAVLRKWFRETTGETPELSSEQLSDVQDAWKNIWGTGLVDPLWAQVYSGKTGIYSPEYVGSDIHYYNVEWSKIDFDYLRAFLDKNYMDVILPCVKHPPTLIRKIHGQYLDVGFNPITKQQAAEKLFENLDPGVAVKISRASSGGVGCGVKPDGRLNDCGHTQKGERYDVHPNGFVFSEGFVPNFDKALEAVKRCHMHVPMFGVASWDIAIDAEGEPVLIEYNVGGAGIDIHQYNNGPLYGKYRERIIADAFKNYAERGATLDFNYSIARGEATLSNGSKDVHNLIIPALIDGKPVRTLASSAFKNSDKLESVIIEASLNEIGYLAFYNCPKLKQIEFKAPVKTISRSAFNHCTALESVVIPSGCEKICSYAFRTCKKLRQITIPDSVTEIEPDAFLESPNVMICCKKGSAAESYAIENGLKYKA